MKTLIIVLVLFGISFSTVTITLNDKCTCTQIKSKADCINLQCSWLNDGCVESGTTTETLPISVYCTSLDSTTCPTIKGCALIGGNCEQFSGCSAYSGTSNDVCYQISNQCTSDGTQCVNPLNCVDYTTEILCSANINSSGRRCKWENSACRNQKCIEASTTLATDTECNAFLPGCLTNGKGCVESRGTCSSYVNNCAGMIGSDGYCEVNGSNCQAKLCTVASTDLNTNALCSKFQVGCITTGRGCVLNTLPSCTTYIGDATVCQQMIGSEGKCDGGSTNCQARECKNASTSNNTDQLCKGYLSTCITNGAGCVTTLPLCNTYTGDNTQCNLYLGSDGKCTLGTNGCKARVCTEAANTLITDTDCAAYQTGCVTNGQGCVLTRSLCSSYNGTAATCLKYIGSDGKCTGTGDTVAACSLQNCNTAPTTYTNNNQCSIYQNDCLTNGVGCVAKTTCSATIAEISCTGTGTCQWTNVCVTNTSCQYYNTISLCYNNLANGKSCFWSNNVCRLRLCTDAPTIYTTNQQCDSFLVGCLTTGNGCIASTSPCSSYNGTQTTCLNFIGNGIKCTSLSVSNAACIDVICESNTTATDQNACDLHLLGCKFQGTAGCLSPSFGCTSYTGNQDACNTYRGENGTVKCYQNTGVVSNCRDLVCSDNTTATSDAECKSFMSTCLTMGTGCISATSPCSSYPGSNSCSSFIGNSKPCWWEGGSFCVDKLCTHNTAATSDDTCNQFLNGCVTSGIGCISKTEICTSYQGNESQCQAFKGNGIPCARKNACQNRRCSDVLNPTNSNTCTTYLSTCRFNGSACIDSQIACTSYTSLNYQICQQITTSSGGKCYLGSGQGACLTRICSQASGVTSQTDCDNFLTGCVFTGSTCTDKVNACESYTNFTPLACESAVTISGSVCWRAQNTIGACATRTCAGVTASLNPYSFSTTFCLAFLTTCRYNGTICVNVQAACASYTGFNQAACKAVTISSTSELCWMESATDTVCASRSCTDTVQAPNDTNCKAHKSTCRYNGTSCIDSQTSCALYTGFTSNACQEVSLTNGTTYCWSPSSGSTCQARACTDVLTIYTTANCVQHLSTCTYNGTQCVIAQADCTSYSAFTSTACQAAQTTSAAYCWSPISVPSQCTNRLCSYSISSPSETNCSTYKSTCRYNGQICVDQQTSCTLYTSFTQSACQQTTTTGGAKCWKSSNSVGICEDRNCSNAVINPNYTTCTAHLSTCTYDGTGCFAIQSTCTLYTNLTAAQCQNVLTTSGGKCWLAYGSGTCQVRQCTHNTVATTDVECAAFLTGCRTTGQGCVDSTTVCSSYIGTVSSCFTFLGNSIPCTGVDSSGPCTNKNCQDNMDSSTDLACSNFMSGCLARSKGCIASTSGCSSYLGTQLICSQFKGNGKNCWNNSYATATTQCRDKLCTDDTTSITDVDCQNIQTNCVTNARGCIDVTATCSQYTGTQAQCSKFKGLNGTKLCWNSSTATPLTSCVDRVCSHNNSAINDTDCNTFLIGCVTKGQGCVSPQPCSSFLGTSKTCPTFTATDRPCKGTTTSTQSSCVAVKCNEAPNSYNTDQLCNTFKEGCVTNGFGCVSSVNCEDIQTQKACQSKSTCTYSGNCRDLQTNCSVFTSQSVCVNTPVNTINGMCAWDQNATTGIGTCRNWTCTDASYSLQTHSDCQTLWDKCTTKGRGCVMMGACSTYTDSTTCSAATTTDEGSFCVWNSTQCRALNCSDASTDFNTDTKCQQFLSNCVTSGKGCVSKQYKCSEILTKDKCLNDYSGNTCLWTIYGCKTFTKCTDISGVAYIQCQQYSSKCTSNGTTCIALAPCSNYTNPTSCYIGTDGQCGWITATLNIAAHCTKFTQCSDGVGTSNELCQQFSTLCVSDGVGCIQIGSCSSYLTSIACQSEGTDGFCFWDATTCRLRTCTDATVATAIEITSHSKCNAFKATTSCTTNGTNCVSMGLCTSYKEPGCFYGTDGECIYDLPSGQVQGTKSCRLKVCTDYSEVTTELCQLHKSQCVSNGTYCITKNNCATYKTKVACNSGGLDGVCVFTPSVSDINTGTCALMTKCAQANSDAIACKSKYNACTFLVSIQSGVQVTSCIDNTCTTVATGSNCKPLYSFDEKSISVCLTTSTGCTVGEPSQLSASTCFASSLYTYTWNSVTNLCQKCTQTTTNQTNSTTNNTNQTSSNTSYAQILFFPLAMILL